MLRSLLALFAILVSSAAFAESPITFGFDGSLAGGTQQDPALSQNDIALAALRGVEDAGIRIDEDGHGDPRIAISFIQLWLVNNGGTWREVSGVFNLFQPGLIHGKKVRVAQANCDYSFHVWRFSNDKTPQQQADEILQGVRTSAEGFVSSCFKKT